MFISINPYLSFDGNCLDAMTFYKNALDAELETMTVKGTPVEAEMPPEYQNKIMHSALKIDGKALLMGADIMPGSKLENGNNVQIIIQIDDEKKGETWFNNLSEGANVVMPWGKTFWGAMFGQLVDKYGITWMVNYEAEA